MNKLRLELDDLRVDTFSTTSHGHGAGGTVRGHGDSDFEVCEPESMNCTNACNTVPPQCQASGGGTCDYTCGYSCQATCATCYLQQTCVNLSCSPCEPQEPTP
jgi:hypothetical protein